MSPTNRNTRSAWSWLTCSGSRPLRGGVRVAGVRAGAGDDGADVQHRPGGGERRPGQRGDRRAAGAGGGGCVEPPQEQHGQTPMIASEQSRWSETIHGFRSVSTVMPPITAWAGMPSADDQRQRAQVAAAGAASAATNVRDRDRDQHEGEHPVAELDRRVDAERAVRA